MSEHVKKLRCVGEPCSTDEMVAEFAADHLERCEKLLARYYASHNDPKFGPCDCDACVEYRKVRVE